MLSIPVEYRGEKYYFNISFDCQSKKYVCILTDGKKPVCGISSGDFEVVRSWVNRRQKKIKITM